MGTPTFDHERLDVYARSIEFAAWAAEFLDGSLAKSRATAAKHLESAATSIALNIAEGNGKRSLPDRCRFLDVARGSALESAACLDILVATKAVQHDHVGPGKAILARIVAMLSRMVASLLGSASGLPVRLEHEHEHEQRHAVRAPTKP